MNLRNILSGIALLAGILSAHAIEYTPANVSASIALKVPGNDAVRYPLEFRKLRQERFDYQLTGTESLPRIISNKAPLSALFHRVPQAASSRIIRHSFS